MIGTCTVYFNKNKTNADIGLLIGVKKFQCKGFGFEVLKNLIKYLFLNAEIKSVTAGTHIKNKAMQKICLKSKMKRIEKPNAKKNFIYFRILKKSKK